MVDLSAKMISAVEELSAGLIDNSAFLKRNSLKLKAIKVSLACYECDRSRVPNRRRLFKVLLELSSHDW